VRSFKRLAVWIRFLVVMAIHTIHFLSTRVHVEGFV
jgi:hypothetical protein